MSAGASARGRAVRGGRAAPAPAARALTTSESAWLAALPCALALLAAILLLGPPLGRLLLAPSGASDFWPHYVEDHVVRPEPTERARYVLALLGPLLVAGCALALSRGRRLREGTSVALTALGRAGLIAFVVVCVVYQQRLTYDASYVGSPFRTVYFTPRALIVSLAFGLLAAAALGSEPLRLRLERALRETPARRAAAFAVAAVLVAAWLLSAFNTDGSLVTVHGSVAGNINFWLDESVAILNGQAPLVDFNAQYGHLWSYIAAGALALLGTSFAVYSATMLAGTVAALVALLATLRAVTRSATAAVALFLPVLATGFFMEDGPLENRYGPANLFSFFPMRYAGPYVLLWLVIRRVRRRPPSPPVALFTFAGLVAINNVEFGLPALGAAAIALIAADRQRSAAAVVRIAGSAAAGLALAAAIVAALTLAVAGSLPDFGMLATFPRIYGTEGFGLLPAPALGVHLVVYVTFSAALVVAVVRAADGAEAGLTAALAWAGTFGLGAGAYFMGRSHPHVLIGLFSAWSLALALLVVVVVRAALRRPPGRPTAAGLLVLTGFGVALCSLAQTPTPWSQLDRLRSAPPASLPGLLSNATRRVVATATRPGEPVALLMKEGHRIADDLGRVDVTPYANLESMLTREQWEETIAALRAAHGTTIVAPHERLLDEQVDWLERRGYRPVHDEPVVGVIVFSDAQ